MSGELKFSDILKRGRLDESTAQYALKSEELKKMPKAGRQGLHRKFSVSQAVRLSVCTHLTMLGVPLRKAAKVVRFCEYQVRATNVDHFDRPLSYERSYNVPWILEIYDGRFVRVWCGDLDDDYPARWTYLDLKNGRTVKMKHAPDALVSVEFDLTKLERMITGNDE